MHKPTNKTIKLTLRRTTCLVLTAPVLGQVAGGGTLAVGCKNAPPTVLCPELK